jgi:hypothetical protein
MLAGRQISLYILSIDHYILKNGCQMKELSNSKQAENVAKSVTGVRQVICKHCVTFLSLLCLVFFLVCNLL